MIPYEMFSSRRDDSIGGLSSSSPFQCAFIMERGGPDRRSAGGEAETVQALADGLGGLDCGKDTHRASALGTLENVNREHAAHELGPGVVARP